MTAIKPIIHVVDDDESFRTAVTRLLRATGYQVRSYASASAFLTAELTGEPGCVVSDVRMPGLDGLDLQQSLGRMQEPLPVIFLTAHGDIPMSVRAMLAGAVDFLTKPVRREVLLRAVESALARDALDRSARQMRNELRLRYETLTPRERQVLALVVRGKLNKQIAGDLGTVERTIKAHRARIMEKMRVDSVAELVATAMTLGTSQHREPNTGC